MRIGVVILPDLRWPQAFGRWREAEQRGFATAWTYDHLSWRSLRDEPWLGAVPLLAAVAASTTTLRLGTLVATPNYRHPVLFAKDVMTLDEISGGRIDLGLGAGPGNGYDADALGLPHLSAADRASRFQEFVEALDRLLTEPAAAYSGRFFTAVESRTYPGCTQQPRVPFTLAATGPRGLGLTARHAQAWVTFGPLGRNHSPDEWYDGLRRQRDRLDEQCALIDRDPASLRRVALVGLETGWAQSSIAAWDDFTGRIEGLGFTEAIVHWPRPHDARLPGPPPDVHDHISDRLTKESP
jgi:alkanesulfonate monooxygenase SsuD/methylene tetrahydromethanopterin reductase-like flavin-dependent oxidoreductase (luciferase family)